MFNFQEDQYNQYQFDYSEFVGGNKSESYGSLSAGVSYKSDIAALLTYSALQKSEQIFLVVPSIFNSPEILFLNKKRNFIDNLQKKGEVYLVNWQENANQLVLEDYVNELQRIIVFLRKTENRKINLIGHCIGGAMCIAIAQTASLS